MDTRIKADPPPAMRKSRKISLIDEGHSLDHLPDNMVEDTIGLDNLAFQENPEHKIVNNKDEKGEVKDTDSDGFHVLSSSHPAIKRICNGEVNMSKKLSASLSSLDEEYFDGWVKLKRRSFSLQYEWLLWFFFTLSTVAFVLHRVLGDEKHLKKHYGKKCFYYVHWSSRQSYLNIK